MVELTHDNIAEVESRYFHDSPLGLFRQYRYQLNRRISRRCARIIFQRGLTGGLFAGSTKSKQWRIELLYWNKRAKTNKITVLNIYIYIYIHTHTHTHTHIHTIVAIVSLFVYFKLYLYLFTLNCIFICLLKTVSLFVYLKLYLYSFT